MCSGRCKDRYEDKIGDVAEFAAATRCRAMSMRIGTGKWKHDYPPPSKPNTKIYALKKAKKLKFKTFVWQGSRYLIDNYTINKKTGKLNKKYRRVKRRT